MDVKQLIKRLEKMEQDKIVIYMDSDGGWDNIELKETEHNVTVYCDGGSPFSSDK